MTRILTIALIAVCAWILPAQGQTVDKGLASRMDPAGLRELYQICRHTTLSVRQQEKLAELLEECSAEFKDTLLGNDGFLTLEDEKRLEKMRDKALRATLSEAQLLEYFRYLCVPEATRAGHEARDIVSGQLKLTYMEKKYINNTFYVIAQESGAVRMLYKGQPGRIRSETEKIYEREIEYLRQKSGISVDKDMKATRVLIINDYAPLTPQTAENPAK